MSDAIMLDYIGNQTSEQSYGEQLEASTNELAAAYLNRIDSLKNPSKQDIIDQSDRQLALFRSHFAGVVYLPNIALRYLTNRELGKDVSEINVDADYKPGIKMYTFNSFESYAIHDAAVNIAARGIMERVNLGESQSLYFDREVSFGRNINAMPYSIRLKDNPLFGKYTFQQRNGFYTEHWDPMIAAGEVVSLNDILKSKFGINLALIGSRDNHKIYQALLQ